MPRVSMEIYLGGMLVRLRKCLDFSMVSDDDVLLLAVFVEACFRIYSVFNYMYIFIIMGGPTTNAILFINQNNNNKHHIYQPIYQER